MLGLGEEQPAPEEHTEHAGYRGDAIEPGQIQRPGAETGDQRQREAEPSAAFAENLTVLAGQHVHHFPGDVIGFGVRMFEHTHAAFLRQAQGAAARELE